MYVYLSPFALWVEGFAENDMAIRVSYVFYTRQRTILAELEYIRVSNILYASTELLESLLGDMYLKLSRNPILQGFLDS
jgi:hypothetical protein